MKFVHLAASLLLLNTGFLYSQSGYNGPAPLAALSPAPNTSSATFQTELERDNFDRLHPAEQKQYVEELTSCLLPEKSEPSITEDDRLTEKTALLSRELLLSIDEQVISDPEADEEGMELLDKEIQAQQRGQVALLSDQLSTVMAEYQVQNSEEAYLDRLLQEDFIENQEPVHWLVQVELGQIR